MSVPNISCSLRIIYTARLNSTSNIESANIFPNIVTFIVTVLDLSYSEIVGTIPDHIFIFQSGEAIYLDNNPLTGQIPDVIFNLSNLQVLSINHNSINGLLATDFGQLTSLKTLFLDDILI